MNAKKVNRRVHAMLAFSTMMCCQTLPVTAQTAPTSMDLNSTQRTVAPSSLGSGSTVIRSGGHTMIVNSTTQLTPAENQAVSQVMATGRQSLVLGALGNAIAGSLNIGGNVDIASLVIPKGVTSFTTASTLNILGNLTNYGVFSVDKALSNAAGTTLNADSIFNNVGAVIKSAVSLNLNALHDIVNSGTITSVGNLGLSAQRITNSGLIAAGNDININSPDAGDIVFDNTGGVLQAGGNINVRDAAFTEKANFLLAGGDVYARNLNIWSGCGNIDVAVNDLTAIANASAANIHISAITDMLHIGNIFFQEDPTFFNKAGSISIDGAISSGTNNVAPGVAIVATGDVTSTASGSINTQVGGTTGFPIIIIAGANFTTIPINATGNPSVSAAGTGDTTTTLTINGASSTGGMIDLTQLTGFSTSGGANSDGGNVTLVAFPGSSANSGTVATGNITTNAGGNANINGNVTIIAGAKNDPSGSSVVTTGSIITDTQGASQGGILIVTGTPVVTNGPFNILNGVVNTGAANASIGSNNVNPGASITVGALTTNAAPITLVSGNNVTLNGGLTTNGVPSSGLFGPGGNITVLAGGNITSPSAIAISTSGGTGSNNAGGTVTMVAGSAITGSVTHTFSGSGIADSITTSFDVTGPSLTGGSITMTQLSGINTTAGTQGPNGGAPGGNVSLAAFGGTTSGSGAVSMPAVSIQTGGAPITGTSPQATTNNVNGSVSILAGGTSGQTINVGNIDTTGGNEGGGSISIQTAAPSLTALPYSYGYQSDATTNPITTSGSITTPGTLANANATVGNLTAEGGNYEVPPPSGGVATNATTDIAIKAGGTLGIGSVTNVNNTLSTQGTPSFPSSTISLESGGAMTINGNISNNAGAAITGVTGQDGGSISLKAASFNLPSPVTVSAVATGGYYSTVTSSGGNGGTISIVSTSSTSDVTVNASAGFTLLAQADSTGGNGGTISISSGRNISVTTPSQNLSVAAYQGSPLSVITTTPPAGSSTVTGNGGNIELLAPAGTVFISGNLDASGAPSSVPTGGGSGNLGGNGGTISIVVNTPAGSPFAINSSSATANGTTSPITANGNATLNVGSIDSFGSGGTISVKNLGAGGITVGTAVTQGIQVQAAAAVDPSGGTIPPVFAGNGGTIILDATAKGAAIAVTGNLQADGGSGSSTMNGGNGGTVQITVNTASGNPFIVDPTATTNGVTGTLSASGNVQAVGGVTASNNTLMLIPSGNGGTISITNLGAGGIGIGTAGISVAAANADQNLSGGANLPGHNRAGQGGNISLIAPLGPVLSLANLSVSGGLPNGVSGQSQNDGGDGGTITIVNNSSTQQFMVGTGSDAPGNTTFGVGNGVSGTINADGYSGGKISITSNSAKGTQIGNDSGNLAISASALVQSFATTPPAGGTGGLIEIIAPKGPVLIKNNLSVNGSDSATGFLSGGNGGSISIITNSTKPFTIGGTASVNGISGTLQANGGAGATSAGNGGRISVINYGTGGINITVADSLTVTASDAAQGCTAGDGGYISLQAPKGPVLITGDLTANGGAAYTGNTTDPYTLLVLPPAVNNTEPSAAQTSFAQGLGGTIYIVSASTSPFAVGGTTGIKNGTTGSLQANGWSGGSITIVNNTGGITVASGSLTVTAEDALAEAYFNNIDGRYLGGQGGNISLQAPNSTVFIDGGLSVDGGQSVATSNSTFFPGGDGGQITIISGSTTPFAINSTATKNGSSGTLSASGFNGGAITIINNKSGGISVGDGQLNVSAASGSSNYADVEYLFPGPYSVTFPGDGNGGNGGRINLYALTGKVFIDQSNGVSLSVNGGQSDTSNPSPTTSGNAGTISIITNSTTAFNVGGAASGGNGTAGSLTAIGLNGGTIGIKNLGTGGITFNPTSIVVSGTYGASQTSLAPVGNGGNIDLEAPNGTIQAGAVGTLSADATSNPQQDAQGGTIVLNAKVIKTSSTANKLNLSARGDTATGGFGLGGTIIVNQTSTTATNVLNIGVNSPLNLTVSASLTDGNIYVNSAAGMIIAGKLATGGNPATGTISLTVGGATNIATNNGLLVAGNIILNTVSGNVGSSTGALSTGIQDGTLTFNSLSGSLFVANNSGSGALNTGALSTASGTDTISVTNLGPLNVTGAISTPGTVVLASQSTSSCPTCAISVDNNITASKATLTADGSGTGGGISGSGIVAASKLILNATDDGITLSTATGDLTANVSGTPSGSTTVSIINQGNLTFDIGTSTNLSALSVEGTGSITTRGNITQAESVLIDNSAAGNQSITIGGLLGANTTTSSVVLNGGGSIIQSSSSNLIQAGAITLTSQNGNIGVPTRAFNSNNVYTPGGNAIQVQVVGLSGTPGTLTIDTSNTTTGGNPGTIFVNNNSTTGVELTGVTSGSDVVITTAGDITVSGNVSSNFGSVMLQNTSTDSGVITLNANVIASGGPAVIQNNNNDTLIAGRITINSGVTLQGSSWRIDNNIINAQAGVALLVGTGPFFPPVTGTTPTPAPAVTGSGSVFYGPNSITINASPVDINVTGANVIFSGDTSDAITLDTNVTINAPSQVQTLSALTTAALAAAAGVSGSGVTVSGNTYTIQNTVNLANLNSLNIPGTTTVTFNNFGSANPIAINTGTSTANAKLAGDFNFTSAGSFGSQALINVNSAVTGVVLTAPAGSSIISDGTLQLNIGGNLTVGGKLQANELINIFTGAATAAAKPSSTAVNAGTVALSGTLQSGTATAGGTINIISSGNITQTAGSINASTLAITIGGVNSGYAKSSATLKTLSVDDMTIAGSGSGGNISVSGTGVNVSSFELTVANSPVLINQKNAFTIEGSVLNNLTAQSTTGITTSGDLNCGNCQFSTPSLTFLNNITSTNAFGTISIAAPTGKNLSLIGTDGTISGGIMATSGLVITSPGTLTATGGAYSTTYGAINITSSKAMTLSDVSINAGTAGILLGGVVAPSSILTTGSINITAKAGGINALLSANTVGGNITMIASTGDVRLNGMYQTDGGNVIVASGSGKVTGDATTIVANAAGTAPTNMFGGEIQILSGSVPVLLTGTTPGSSVTQAPGNIPGSPVYIQPDGSIAPLGNNVFINNIVGITIPTGAITQSAAGGAVSLGNTQQAFLNLNGGAMIFNTKGTNSGIQFEGANFTTNSYTPIAFVQRALPPFSTASDVSTKTPFGEVKVRKGALAIIKFDGDALRVVACTDAVSITLQGGKTIDISVGEEAVISDRAITAEQHALADSIGRRNFRNFSLDNKLHMSVCDVSLITVLAQAQELDAVRKPHTPAEKRLHDKMMRAAAALHLVTQNRGPFKAIKKPAKKFDGVTALLPN